MEKKRSEFNREPFYDPLQTYEDNMKYGPFGGFADRKQVITSGDSSFDLFGHSVYLPFGIPAGPLLNGRFVRAALDKGFDIVVYKTVRSRAYPYEGTAHLLCFDIDRTKKIVYAIKSKIGNTPLILKLAFFTDDKVLKKFVKEVGGIVEGLAAINTIPAQIVDKKYNQALPGTERLRSGVCVMQ